MGKKSVTIDISGMSCGHCVTAVTEALQQLPGVTPGRVEIGTARLSYDPSVASPERITEAIAEAGYSAIFRGPE